MKSKNKILFDFFMWFRENGEKHLEKSIEKMIEIYISEIKPKRSDLSNDNDFVEVLFKE